MSVDKGFEDLTTEQMLRTLTERVATLPPDGNAKTLYIWSHLNTILSSSLEDLMTLTSADLHNAQNFIDLMRRQCWDV